MIWLLPIVAYLIGSVSFAWIAGRMKGVDLREHGSKSLGATNAGRVLGAKWFFIVFTADLLKGLLPVLATKYLIYKNELFFDPSVPDHGALKQDLFVISVAAGAILGHVFTCYHGFKGGKAVATSLGALTALLPAVAGSAFAVWLVAWLFGWVISRLPKSTAVGPASVAAAIAAPAFHYWFSSEPFGRDLPMSVFITCLAILVVVKHRSNIAKLFVKPAP